MKRALLTLLCACLAASLIVSAAESAPPVRVLGHVYVNDNTAGTNTIAGYDRQPNGALTPIPGSPFATGGAGAGHANASQGSLEMSSDGRFLLAVDAGSGQISVLRIMADGSLKVADVISSGGGNPVSIAVHDSLVFVANADPTSPNYAGFRLNSGGHLTPIPGSTVSLPAGSQPGDVLFNSPGSKLVGTRVASSLIDSFAVTRDGELTPAPGSPFSAQTGFFGPLGSEFSPTKPDLLFVSNAHTASGAPAFPGSVSAFSDAASGVLSAVGGSPFFNDGTASCWVEINHDGRFLYVVNTGSSTVSIYSIADDGTLSFNGSTSIGGAGAEDARLAPDGQFLWVVEGGADTIAGFSVGTDGALTLLGPATLGPAGATPSGIVVT
jgi:6-phosphogluconolactonase